MEKPAVAYVLLRFPVFTETFVADEITELRRQGIPAHVFSLLPTKDKEVHAESQRLLPYVTYAPSIVSCHLWKAQFGFIRRSPREYIRLLRELLTQRYCWHPLLHGPKRVVVFLKAVWVAGEVERSGARHIHAHFAWLSGAAAAIVSKLTGIPFSVTAHAYDLFVANDLLQFTARSAKNMITISERNKREIQNVCKDANDKVEIIHCGVRREWGMAMRALSPNGHIQILSIGSLIEKKGHAYLIEACAELIARGREVRCTIIGDGWHRDRLSRLICDLGLEDSVILAGSKKREEVLAAFADADVFALCCTVTAGGDMDGIPVALMEAMSLGVPVVSTPVSGIPELVHDEETGLLAPERNPKAIADAIERVVDDPELRQRVCKSARELVQTDFDLETNVRRLSRLFAGG